ncbi:uncharacterized protein LOC116705065 [Etheostoma spectabile]|uniref:uncharacterized protein LOC116705065 n=1 Tax=Etheostoma spectabile TaxID=54343 RepID=UPI0013AFD9A0|nr:uncharacterized protein LOC116705065 [Etheostoma spectabile]
MDTWFLTSLLIILALLNRNVCFPAEKGWSQYDPYEGSFFDMEESPGFHDGSSQGALAHPSIVSYPAVPFQSESMEKGVASSPGSYAASPNPIPVMSGDTSWYAAPGWGTVYESLTAYTTSRTSQPTPDIGLPPPPFISANEPDQYEANVDPGNWQWERETEELRYQLPVPTYPELGFQPGELHLYSSILEHGNEDRDTEQGFMPLPPYALTPQVSSTAST